ncbi:hypothetical protein VNO77_18439 [Canavalia gladiata]|uniref:Uncharacterized protein n=1 Tax=Canavalia gladiata TaxID=3824 RepID=A0AAN9LPN8_CANGL
MSRPKKSGVRVSVSEDPKELVRVPLQAILLADSFTIKFGPITLERPKRFLFSAVLIPSKSLAIWRNLIGSLNQILRSMDTVKALLSTCFASFTMFFKVVFDKTCINGLKFDKLTN